MHGRPQRYAAPGGISAPRARGTTMQPTRPTLLPLTLACIFLTAGCAPQASKTPTSAPTRTVELARRGCTVPFELNSNKIYLNVKVNDAGPWPFVLDMGSNHSLLDLDLARELKL